MAAASHAFDTRTASPTNWPIERPYLIALMDLGLSDAQIASYFRVKQDEVAVLRATFGIAERLEPARSEPPKQRLFPWRRKA